VNDFSRWCFFVKLLNRWSSLTILLDVTLGIGRNLIDVSEERPSETSVNYTRLHGVTS
jgi:hypothetical protein